MTEMGVGASYVITVVGAGVEGLAVARLLAEEAEVGGVRYIAIAPRYAGVDFETFVQIDVLHELAELASDEDRVQAAARLCAVLYRRSRTEKLDSKTIVYRARAWAEDEEAALAILVDYRRMRHWLREQYPRLFPSTGGPPSKKPQALRQWPLLRDLYAEALGITADAANKTLMHDVLRFLNTKAKK